MEKKFEEIGYCMFCEDEIPVKMCCSGHECGCMGMPVDPPLCNKKECGEKWIKISQSSSNSKSKGII